MVNYKLDFSDEGKIAFSSLDKAVAQRILNKLKTKYVGSDSIIDI